MRFEVGAAAALGAMLVARDAARRASRRGWLAGAVDVAAGCCRSSSSPAATWLDQTIGFIGIAGQQRLPFPLDPAGIGLDPNKLLELWFPADPRRRLGAAGWPGRSLRPAGAADWALAPLIATGVAYLLSRTDEFHLVPLSVGAGRRGGARRRAPSATPRRSAWLRGRAARDARR